VTTIGTGFYHATGDEAELFTIFYVVLGVSLIISFITTFVRTVLTDAQDELSGFLHRLWYGPTRPLCDRVLIRYRVALSLIAVFLALLSGTLFFTGNEGWDWLGSVYWCVCLMTTIGYGDKTIQYDSTRIFSIFYIYASVITFAVTINNIAEYWIAYLRRKRLREKLVLMTARRFGEDWCRRTLKCSQTNRENDSNLRLSRNTVTATTASASASGSGSISGVVEKERFILSVLAELGLINYQRDIAPLARKFHELDSTDRGYLTHTQLLEFRQAVEQVSRVAQGVAIEYESTENEIFRHLDQGDANWITPPSTVVAPASSVPATDDHKEFVASVPGSYVDIEMSSKLDEAQLVTTVVDSRT